jgi:hypothetical protein
MKKIDKINKLRKLTDDVLGMTGTSLDTENEICRECFGKKEFWSLTVKERRILSKIISFVLLREMRVIQLTTTKLKYYK